jgi:hypothetical protein
MQRSSCALTVSWSYKESYIFWLWAINCGEIYTIVQSCSVAVSEHRTLCEAFLLLASKYPPTAKAAKSLSSRARRLAKAWMPHCVALPSIFTCQTSAFHLSALPTAIAGLKPLVVCVRAGGVRCKEATTIRAPTYRLQLLTRINFQSWTSSKWAKVLANLLIQKLQVIGDCPKRGQYLKESTTRNWPPWLSAEDCTGSILALRA